MATVQKVQIVSDLTHPSAPTPKRKGLRRSQKEWEESFAMHAGKFIDKLTAGEIMKIVAILGGAYGIDMVMHWFPVWTVIPLPYELKGIPKGGAYTIFGQKLEPTLQTELGSAFFSLFLSYLAVEHGADLLRLFPASKTFGIF